MPVPPVADAHSGELHQERGGQHADQQATHRKPIGPPAPPQLAQRQNQVRQDGVQITRPPRRVPVPVGHVGVEEQIDAAHDAEQEGGQGQAPPERSCHDRHQEQRRHVPDQPLARTDEQVGDAQPGRIAKGLIGVRPRAEGRSEAEHIEDGVDDHRGEHPGTEEGDVAPQRPPPARGVPAPVQHE